MTEENDNRGVTIKEFASWLGVTPDAVVKNPHVRRDSQGYIPLKENIIRLYKAKHHREHDKSESKEQIERNQARLTHAKATMQEMKMLQASMKLVPVSIVEKVNDRYWSTLRASIDGIPSSAAKEANHIDPLQAELAIEKAIRGAFEQAERSFGTILLEIEELARSEVESVWREVAEDAKKDFEEMDDADEASEIKKQTKKRGKPKKG